MWLRRLWQSPKPDVVVVVVADDDGEMRPGRTLGSGRDTTAFLLPCWPPLLDDLSVSVLSPSRCFVSVMIRKSRQQEAWENHVNRIQGRKKVNAVSPSQPSTEETATVATVATAAAAPPPKSLGKAVTGAGIVTTRRTAAAATTATASNTTATARSKSRPAAKGVTAAGTMATPSKTVAAAATAAPKNRSTVTKCTTAAGSMTSSKAPGPTTTTACKGRPPLAKSTTGASSTAKKSTMKQMDRRVTAEKIGATTTTAAAAKSPRLAKSAVRTTRPSRTSSQGSAQRQAKTTSIKPPTTPLVSKGHMGPSSQWNGLGNGVTTTTGRSSQPVMTPSVAKGSNPAARSPHASSDTSGPHHPSQPFKSVAPTTNASGSIDCRDKEGQSAWALEQAAEDLLRARAEEDSLYPEVLGVLER